MIAFFLLHCILHAIAQPDMKNLIKIYNSSSIQTAFTTLSTYKNFSGNFRSDSLKKDSSIVGVIEGDSVIVTWRKNKANINFTLHNEAFFKLVKEQADRKMYPINSYARGSRAVSRQYYAYSDKPEMKLGDLWFILVECRKNSDGSTFYEIMLNTFPDD